MFEDMTPERIRKRILGRLKTDLQTREGSFTNDIIAAAAVEISECYHSMDALFPAFYIDETSGQYIDQQAGTVGIIRKAGTPAACRITFTGTNGTTIPAGTPFYTAAGLAFYLADPVIIRDGTGEGRLIASEAGDAYNIAAGEIVSTFRNYSGITSYSNEAADGGADPETDAALLSRYRKRMQRPSTSGNPYHYQMWALEAAGVGAARVISKWNGPGTVKIILADQEMHPATATAVAACAAHIEAERPVGPAVTVETAGTLAISVRTEITVDRTVTSKPAVRSALEETVQNYLKGLASSGFENCIDLQFESLEIGSYTVLYNRIAFLLLSIPGVVDYTALTLNGGTENQTVPADALPILQEVTVL